MESSPILVTPEEELAYLREQVSQKERELQNAKVENPAAAAPTREEIISETIHEHHAAPAEVLAPAYRMNETTAGETVEKILADLNLGGDEQAIKGLQQTMEERGIKNALTVLEKMHNPHIADDFHRYLVRYIAAGLPALGFDEKAPRFQALKMTLYEISLPGPGSRSPAGEARAKTLKELISGMEQFYAGLLSVADAVNGEPRYYALELAVPADSPELQFYAAIPNSKRSLFEKQLLAIFPNAHLVLQPADYNIFAGRLPDGSQGVSLASTAAFVEHSALPLRDYTDFDYDPINTIINAFAKIEKTGEGAVLQIIIEPRGDRHVKHYQKILQALRKGERRSTAFDTPETALGDIARDIGRTLFSSKPKDEQKAKEAETRQIEANKTFIEQVEKKISAPIVGTTIRLIASSNDEQKANQVLGELEAAFNQFANTQGNKLKFNRESSEKDVANVCEDFSFRLPDARALPLSLRELTTLYHFPPSGIESSPHLKQVRFTHAPAPLSLPHPPAGGGALLGINTYRNEETRVYLDPEDRLRHLYIIGQTGTGKTGLMKSMIMQDIKNGEGCCFIDPHGSDILDILAAVPPERYNDVIYFDPADLSRPFALNFLEYDFSRPEQKTFIVNELLAIFHRLYGDVPESMGPAFEQYFRNATLLVMEDPASGSTMMDIARVLSNKEFREQKLAKSMNPVVNQFWQEIANKAEGDTALANIVPYITNKFDDFTANDFIRPIVGQQDSSFKFREVMDTKKILLINLSKGRLGERNANLLGLIVVGKLFMAALSRADIRRLPDGSQAPYPPFYLYIDEFQNVTTDSIPGILSEARKYKLALTIAHQFLNQIADKTRDAVFGNVGNMAVFRVGEEDAEFFAKQFAPVFEALDFVNIENRNAYVKILSGGVPQKAFDIRTADFPIGNPSQIDDLIHLSSLTYGRDRATVENMIRERYLSH